MRYVAGLGHFGSQIKSERKRQGLTIQGLAGRAGIAQSTVSKVENGRINPTIVTMHKITRALDLNIGALFPEEGFKGLVARAGGRARIGDANNVLLEKLVDYGANHILQANIHIIAPGGGSDGEMQHEGEEVGFVLEGEFELVVDGTSETLTEGDSFNFDSRLRHSYRNLSQSTCRVIWVNTPPTF